MKSLFRRLMQPVLSWQAARLIRRQQPVVVAVTGSVGKTTTRLAIASVLERKFGSKLLAGRHNYNSEIGLPLAMFDQDVPSPIWNPAAWLRVLLANEKMIRSCPYGCLVLEVGTDKPGDLAYFARWLNPDITVVTAVAPEHMEFFKDLDAVAEEELTLARVSRTAIVNADGGWLWQHRRELKKELPNLVAYGSGGMPLWCDDTIALTSDVSIEVHPKVLGEHLKLALLAAAAVGLELELKPEEIKAGLESFDGAPGRMRRFEGVNGSLVIDDTYNSSPDAVQAALSTLKSLPAKRRIAVLGQMNELGDESPRYHQEAGQRAAWVDLLLTIGDNANAYLGPASGLDKGERWLAFDSPYAAGAYLKKILQAGDVVLVKGSQNGVFAEECVKKILADPADAARLVRQSATWQERKRRAFGVE